MIELLPVGLEVSASVKWEIALPWAVRSELRSGISYHAQMNLPVALRGGREVLAFGPGDIQGDQWGGDVAGKRQFLAGFDASAPARG